MAAADTRVTAGLNRSTTLHITAQNADILEVDEGGLCGAKLANGAGTFGHKKGN